MSQVTPTEADVIIVGAGPVGLVSACELTRHGVRCRIVEKRVTPTNHSQACVVQVRTQEVFEAMGLSEGWTHNGYPFEHVVATAAGKRLGVLHLGGVNSPHPSPLMIGQNITERLLIEQLSRAGIKVERPLSMIGFEQDDEGVNVTLLRPDDSHETIRARWLISAEGSGSLVRKSLGIPFIGERYKSMDFIQADTHIRWSYPHGEGRIFINADRFVACFPFDADGYYRILCTHGNADILHNDEPTLEEIQEIVRAVIDPEAELYDPQWLNRFHTQRRKATTFQKGRVFLVGDAGHVHIPVAGQGMNTGIQDAFNLCWKLASVIHNQAHPSILNSYNAERLPVAKALLRGTDLGFKTLAQPNPLIYNLLQAVAPVALHWETCQRILRATIAEVNINYTNSPLVVDTGGDGHISAGERAPDATVVRRRDIKTVRLFEMLHGTHWTLLFFSGERQTDAELLRQFAQFGQTVKNRYRALIEPHLVIINPDTYIPWGGSILMDRDYALHKAYGVHEPCIYLIRPDWYVGFHGKATDGDHMLNYLAKILQEQHQQVQQVRQGQPV